MTIEYRTCLYCGKEWRTGTMDLNRYCSVGCWADDLDESEGRSQRQEVPHEVDQHVRSHPDRAR